MKTKIALLVFLVLAAASFAYSQDNRPPMKRDDQPKRSPGEMLKQEMKMLTEQLELTESQIPFVKKILEDSFRKVQSGFDRGSRDIEEINKLMEERDNNLKLVLTDEQFSKYKSIKSDEKIKMKHEGPPRGKDN